MLGSRTPNNRLQSVVSIAGHHRNRLAIVHPFELPDVNHGGSTTSRVRENISANSSMVYLPQSLIICSTCSTVGSFSFSIPVMNVLRPSSKGRSIPFRCGILLNRTKEVNGYAQCNVGGKLVQSILRDSGENRVPLRPLPVGSELEERSLATRRSSFPYPCKRNATTNVKILRPPMGNRVGIILDQRLFLWIRSVGIIFDNEQASQLQKMDCPGIHMGQGAA